MKEKSAYQILGLGTDSSIQEVVSRALQLSEETIDRAEQAAIRRAVEEINGHPVRRATTKFWEPPGTAYQNPGIESFCERQASSPPAPADLEDRARRFVEEDCLPEQLTEIAVPPISEVIFSAAIDFADKPWSGSNASPGDLSSDA